LSRDFKPSRKSLTPAEQAGARLQYICRAAEVIEKHMNEEGDLPHWVLERVNQSAQLMGMAVSYVSFAQERKLRAEEEKTTGKKKSRSKTRVKKSKKAATSVKVKRNKP